MVMNSAVTQVTISTPPLKAHPVSHANRQEVEQQHTTGGLYQQLSWYDTYNPQTSISSAADYLLSNRRSYTIRELVRMMKTTEAHTI